MFDDFAMMREAIRLAEEAAADGEIPTCRLGDLVMVELKKLNDVAYVRFAAVYRKFTDLTTFMEELQKLLNENSRDPDHEE